MNITHKNFHSKIKSEKIDWNKVKAVFTIGFIQILYVKIIAENLKGVAHDAELP